MKNPTKKQLKILKYIREYQVKHLCSPTQKEVADYFKISLQAANSHIARMAKKGLLEIAEHKHRSISIPEDIDRYQLMRNTRNILIFTFDDLEIPVSEFIGRYFKIVG